MRALSLAILLAGCGGPVVVWHGRSPDRDRSAVLLEENGRQRVVVDGNAHPSFDSIAFTHLAWSTRGLVYPARAGERWRVVVGREEGPSFASIGDIVASADRVAYCAQSDEGWHVVVGREIGPAFRSLRAGSLTLAGDRALYIAREDGGERAVIGGAVGPLFDRVGEIVLGAKGSFAIYAAQDGERAHLVTLDRTSEPYDDVLALVAAQDEPRWAAIVREGDGFKILHDGRAIATRATAADLRISPDGSHVAWLEAGREVEIFLDGRRLAAHRDVDRMQFVPRTNALLYVAHEEEGVRLVHEGRAGPRFASIEDLAVSTSGHYGYVGARGVGRAVLIDGVVRFRGEWAGALALAARAEGWVFVARHAGRRFVVTRAGRVPVEGPFVDTLVIDPEGRSWAIASADRHTRRFDVLVDGRPVAPLDFDEVSAAITQGREPASVVRQIVRAELARSMQ
jgi:hypothetical protein